MANFEIGAAVRIALAWQGRNITQAARDARCSRTHLSRVLRGERRLTADMLGRLGLRERDRQQIEDAMDTEAGDAALAERRRKA